MGGANGELRRTNSGGRALAGAEAFVKGAHQIGGAGVINGSEAND